MVPTWMWSWAWRSVMRWGRLEIDAGTVDISDRWAIVRFVSVAKFRSLIVRPAVRWFLERLPRWFAIRRLQRCGSDWYRISGWRASEHCRLRFGLAFSLDEGDFVRIQHGEVVSVAWEMLSHCEIAGVTHGEVTE